MHQPISVPSANTCTNLFLCPVNWIPFLCGCVQDVARLYKQQQEKVRVTLVESNQILSSFDDRLRSYAEKKITQRKRFTIVHSSVTGEELCQRALPAIWSLYSMCTVCVAGQWGFMQFLSVVVTAACESGHGLLLSGMVWHQMGTLFLGCHVTSNGNTVPRTLCEIKWEHVWNKMGTFPRAWCDIKWEHCS